MIITLPIRLRLSKSPRAKRYALNLNNYRNWHYQVSNKIKVKYKELVKSELTELNVKQGQLDNKQIIYTLYWATKRKVDISNVLCIVDKFFCDAVVELGYLTDDNYNYLKDIRFEWGGYSKDCERVEIEIK